MNHYAAREMLGPDGKGIGKWHYTVANDREKGAYPVGYCANGCPGHDTPEAAREHYRQYLIDGAVFRGPKAELWPKHKCAADGCNEEAIYCASVSPYRIYELCANHANKESVAALVQVGESWQS